MISHSTLKETDPQGHRLRDYTAHTHFRVEDPTHRRVILNELDTEVQRLLPSQSGPGRRVFAVELNQTRIDTIVELVTEIRACSMTEAQLLNDGYIAQLKALLESTSVVFRQMGTGIRQS